MRGLLLLLLLFATATTAAQTVYVNDFESGDVAGWTTSIADPTYQRPIAIGRNPIGDRRFLGEFGSQIVRFTTVGLPRHDSVVVELDLYVIRSWDGNRTNTDGPDQFLAGDGEYGQLLRTTFSNKEELRQAYPGSHPGGSNPAFTGASDVSRLGYAEGDAVYRLRFAYPHTGATLSLTFEAQLRDRFPTVNNESWGIDNVRISTIAPRAAAATLVAGEVVGAVGERVFIPIHVRDAVSVMTSGATSIRTTMRFNGSMLMPEMPTPRGRIEGSERVIDLDLPLSISGDSVIARVNFRVMVGDDTVTTITLESSEAVGGEIAFRERAGVFRVTGLCEDGGTRLFRAGTSLLLRPPYPNPARDGATVEYELAADEQVRIDVVDAAGATVATPVDGVRAAGRHVVVVEPLAVGRYTVRLRTRYESREAPLVVAR